MTPTPNSVVTDEMIRAFLIAADSEGEGFGAERGSFLWEETERGLRAALSQPTGCERKMREALEAAQDLLDVHGATHPGDWAEMKRGVLELIRSAISPTISDAMNTGGEEDGI